MFVSLLPSLRRVNGHLIIVETCLSPMNLVLVTSHKWNSPSIHWILFHLENYCCVVIFLFFVLFNTCLSFHEIIIVSQNFEAHVIESVSWSHGMECNTSNFNCIVTDYTIVFGPSGCIKGAPGLFVMKVVGSSPRLDSFTSQCSIKIVINSSIWSLINDSSWYCSIIKFQT